MNDFSLISDEFEGDEELRQDKRGPSRIRRSATAPVRKPKSKRSQPNSVARKGMHQRRIKRMSW